MFKTGDISYLKPPSLNYISFILCIVYGLCFNLSFKFIESLIEYIQFVFGFVCGKYGSPQS